MIIIRQRNYGDTEEGGTVHILPGKIVHKFPDGSTTTYVLPEGQEAYTTTDEYGRMRIGMRPINPSTDPVEKSLEDTRNIAHNWLKRNTGEIKFKPRT